MPSALFVLLATYGFAHPAHLRMLGKRMGGRQILTATFMVGTTTLSGHRDDCRKEAAGILIDTFAYSFFLFSSRRSLASGAGSGTCRSSPEAVEQLCGLDVQSEASAKIATTPRVCGRLLSIICRASIWCLQARPRRRGQKLES